MKQATKMVLGATAIVAVSAGVAGVTTYTMLLLMMCSSKVKIQDWLLWMRLICNRSI
jgi:hypothetical protein